VLRGLALAIAAALVVAGAALALVKRTPVTPPAPMVGLSVVLGPDLFLDTTPGGSKVALSPDGSRLAFVGRSGGRTRLFLRRLDRFENTVLPGTDNGLAPFFSPDGRWIGFVTLDGIKRMAVDGATPELVCPAPEAEGGAAWLTDDTVIFGGGQGVGLMRVSARGGTPRALTHVDTLRNEVMHSDPTVLPGGRTALFTVTVFDTTGVHARIEAVSLESVERRTVLDDGELVGYVEGVGIIFNRGMGVLAASFDPERLAVTGDPVPVVHDADDIAVTRNGMIAYHPWKCDLTGTQFCVGRHGWRRGAGRRTAPHVHESQTLAGWAIGRGGNLRRPPFSNLDLRSRSSGLDAAHPAPRSHGLLDARLQAGRRQLSAGREVRTALVPDRQEQRRRGLDHSVRGRRRLVQQRRPAAVLRRHAERHVDLRRYLGLIRCRPWRRETLPSSALHTRRTESITGRSLAGVYV
jgi:hypothetical protein